MRSAVIEASKSLARREIGQLGVYGWSRAVKPETKNAETREQKPREQASPVYKAAIRGEEIVAFFISGGAAGFEIENIGAIVVVNAHWHRACHEMLALRRDMRRPRARRVYRSRVSVVSCPLAMGNEVIAGG